MHQRSVSVLFACLGIVLAQSNEYSPLFDPIQYARGQPLILHKRQTCPTGYNNCGYLGSGADGACCSSDQNCAVDAAGHVACCPSNAVCTGTIDGTITVSVTTSTTNTPVPGETTTTGSFNSVNPITTGVAGGGSTVPNTYYPFTYIPTFFANAGICSSYWTSCQSASASCFTSLAGTNGVTVSGVAGGTTIMGQSALVAISASSICSSLSATACRGLSTQRCNGDANAGGPRPTPCPGLVYAMGAGAVVGAAGALMQ
jgi:hypothetical protein